MVADDDDVDDRNAVKEKFELVFREDDIGVFVIEADPERLELLLNDRDDDSSDDDDGKNVCDGSFTLLLVRAVNDIGCLKEAGGTPVTLLFAAEVTSCRIALDENLEIVLVGYGAEVGNEEFLLDVIIVEPFSTTNDG